MPTSKKIQLSPLSTRIALILIASLSIGLLLVVSYTALKSVYNESLFANNSNIKISFIIPFLFISLATLILIIKRLNDRFYDNPIEFKLPDNKNYRYVFDKKTIENNDIYDALYNQIRDTAIADNIEDIKQAIKAQSKENDILNIFNIAISKIEKHSKFLSGFLYINLFIGIAFAATSLSIVFFYTPNIPIEVSSEALFIATIAIKLLFAGSVQMLALFFLNLYKKTLLELKYLQNEITNIELKKSSVLLSSEFSEKNKLKISMSLINTERNTLLQNGESTEYIEQVKSDSTEMVELLKTLQIIAKK